MIGRPVCLVSRGKQPGILAGLHRRIPMPPLPRGQNRQSKTRHNPEQARQRSWFITGGIETRHQKDDKTNCQSAEDPPNRNAGAMVPARADIRIIMAAATGIGLSATPNAIGKDPAIVLCIMVSIESKCGQD